MDFTPQGAFDYVKSKLDDFYIKGNILYQQEDALNTLVAQYQTQGLDQTDLDTIFGEVNNELLQWQSISNKLTPVLTYFGYTPASGTSLGIDPFTLAAIAASLLAVAALMWSWYNSSRIDAHNTAIKVLAANVQLSPTDQAVIDQATTAPSFLGSIFSGLGNMGTYLLIGGAIYLWIISRR